LINRASVDRFDFADLVKNEPLHRAIHTNQRKPLPRRELLLSGPRHKGGNIDASAGPGYFPTWPITPGCVHDFRK